MTAHRQRPPWWSLLALAIACLAARPAAAHTTGESFFVLDAAADRGLFELALRDLDDAVVLDQDGDGQISGRELRLRAPAIAAHLDARVILQTSVGRCRPTVDHVGVRQRSGGAYAALSLSLHCPRSGVRDDWRFEDDLFFERDGLHRAFVTFTAGARSETQLLRADATVATFVRVGEVPGKAAALRTLVAFVREGALHIWQGFDHVLFLLVLLLPAVLRRKIEVDAQGAVSVSWQPVGSGRAAMTDVLAIVTAFTVAHSITLALSALEIVHAAPAIIEPAIAASVLLAALNNLWPLFGPDNHRRWSVAFALGLLHGFGFSSALSEIGLPAGHRLAALFGFNLGVEVGQLALVALVLPASYWLRRTVAYRRVGLAAGSLAAAICASIWFVERCFGLRLFG